MNNTEEILSALRNQEMVVIMDDEDRENEGDLIKIAEYITADDINFMAQHARGLICLTLTAEHCQRLQLPLMTQHNGSTYHTNFTVSIEATNGVTTGISAADRAHTIRTAVAQQASCEDICSPGHVFPLRAVAGGVLSRAGHTEAGCDLAALAGASAASVIVEILSQDGSMARKTELEQFAKTHNLKIGTINDLIAYRFKRETTVELVASHDMIIGQGQFTVHLYRDMLHDVHHTAIVKGTINPNDTVVRVCGSIHLDDLVSLTSARWSFADALAYIATQPSGVVVVLDQAQLSLAQLIAHHKAHKAKPPQQIVWRDNGIGSQILQHLGVQKMRILGEPLRYNALSGFGLDIIEYIAPRAPKVNK